MSQEFAERISGFLKDKMAQIQQSYGPKAPEYQALARQYYYAPSEDEPSLEDNLKHYNASVGKDIGLKRAERLYQRTALINISQVCVANCRFCLRSNYENEAFDADDLVAFARYCGNEANRQDLTEILVTGGDPLLARARLRQLVTAINEHAPNIRRIRIGTRLPIQDPKRIDADLLDIFRNPGAGVRFELAIQINHPVELFPETTAALSDISDAGVRIYAQNVLLKGVNDDIDVLLNLYNGLRELAIESHYLFHCCPIVGMRHFRTSLDLGLILARELTASGRISGRSKPLFAAMTDIGKIVLYDGSILARRGPRILIQSRYSYQERMQWNPTWELPDSAEIDAEGYLRVWYLDGDDSLTLPAKNTRLPIHGQEPKQIAELHV